MKKIFLILFSIAFTVLSTAQVSSRFAKNIKWKDIEKSKKQPDPILVGNTDRELFFISNKKGKHTLQNFSVGSLLLKNSRLLELEFRKKKLHFIDSYMIGDNPVLLTSFYNKKTNTNYLFYHVVNPKTLMMGPPKVLAKKVFKKTKKAKRKVRSIYSFEGITTTSSDDKSISFVTFPDPAKEELFEDKVNKSYIAKIFDENFNEVNNFSYNFPFDNFDIRQTVVSKDGLAYIIVDKLVKDETVKKKRSPRFLIEDTYLLYIDVTSGESDFFKLELEDRNFSQIGLKTLRDGGLAISGLTEREGESGVDGSFSIVYDKDMVEVNNSIESFEKDFITATWSNRAKKKIAKKNKKRDRRGKKKITPQFYNYYVDHIIELSDGSYTMLAEQYYVRVVTTTHRTANGGSYTTTTYYYYYNDIIAVNYDKKGEFQWKKRIKKHQVSTNDGGYYSSYFVVENDDDIEIIYNEGKVAVKVQLGPEGSIRKDNIIEFSERRMRLVPKQCGLLKDTGVFLYAKGKTGSKFGVLKL